MVRKSAHVVILHGWGLSEQNFIPLALELKSRGFMVHTTDLPGFGSAGIPEIPLTVNDYTDHLDTFLKHRNITHPIIIGHSFGGRIGIVYAYRYPANVSALILTGTPGYRTVSPLRIYAGKLAASAGKALFSIPPFSISKILVRDVFYQAIGVRDFVRAKGVMKETFKLIVEYNLTDSMKGLKVPTILIWGENDGVVPVRIARKMERTIPGARLRIISGADHRVPYMHAQLFSDEVVSFLGAHRS